MPLPPQEQHETTEASVGDQPSRVWSPPRLTVLGDIDLTRGAFASITDGQINSGNFGGDSDSTS